MDLRRIQALNELEAIETAHAQIIDERFRFILYRRFLQSPTTPNWLIGQEMGYGKTRFQELMNMALIAFAECYRGGE